MGFKFNAITGELDVIKETTSLDTRYLKLDASNDPITGDLTIQPTNSTTALQVNQADGTNVLTVDTATDQVIINTGKIKSNVVDDIASEHFVFQLAVDPGINAYTFSQDIFTFKDNSGRDRIRFNANNQFIIKGETIAGGSNVLSDAITISAGKLFSPSQYIYPQFKLQTDANNYIDLSVGNIVFKTSSSGRVFTIMQANGPFIQFYPWEQKIQFANTAYNRYGEINTSGGGLNINAGGVVINIDAPTNIGQTIKGAAAQSANLQEWQNSAGSVLSYITPTGGALFSDKVMFTQTDGNEYIDSLADGYMDYRATTAHRFGDGTNQTLLASDGRMTMEGTARFWIGWEIDNSNFKEPTSQSATKVNRGLGTAYEYSDGQEEHIHATIRITGRWDHTENLEVILVWETPTVSANCDWEVRYQFKAVDEDMTDTATTTVNCLAESSSTANGLVHSTCVIPSSAFDAGDKILSLTIWRDGNDTADTLGASAYLHKMIVRGIANKLGGTVT